MCSPPSGWTTSSSSSSDDDDDDDDFDDDFDFEASRPADEDLAVFFFEDDGLDASSLISFTAESHVVGFSPGGAGGAGGTDPVATRPAASAAALNAPATLFSFPFLTFTFSASAMRFFKALSALACTFAAAFASATFSLTAFSASRSAWILAVDASLASARAARICNLACSTTRFSVSSCSSAERAVSSSSARSASARALVSLTNAFLNSRTNPLSLDTELAVFFKSASSSIPLAESSSNFRCAFIASCRHASADLCSALANASTTFFLLLPWKSSSRGVGVARSVVASSSPPLGGAVESKRTDASSTYTPVSTSPLPRIGSHVASAASVPVHSLAPQLDPSRASRRGADDSALAAASTMDAFNTDPNRASRASRVALASSALGDVTRLASLEFTITVTLSASESSRNDFPSNASVTFITTRTICFNTSASVAPGSICTPSAEPSAVVTVVVVVVRPVGAAPSLAAPRLARTHGASSP